MFLLIIFRIVCPIDIVWSFLSGFVTSGTILRNASGGVEGYLGLHRLKLLRHGCMIIIQNAHESSSKSAGQCRAYAVISPSFYVQWERQALPLEGQTLRFPFKKSHCKGESFGRVKEMSEYSLICQTEMDNYGAIRYLMIKVSVKSCRTFSCT